MHQVRIAIDIGNTRLKAAAFDVQTAALLQVWTSALDGTSLPIPAAMQPIVVGWASVSQTLPAAIATQFASVPIIHLTTASQLPITNSYATPETLGIDRLLAAVGAYKLVQERGALLVIDAGTAITYDFVMAEGVYVGGGISLGRAMRYRALHHFTARLPDISTDMLPDAPALIGTSTHTAIRSGVDNGMLAEVVGIVQQYQHHVSGVPLTVFFTGGDAEFLATHLKSPTFATCYVESHLVLHGIHFALLNA